MGSSCIYPPNLKNPIKENQLLQGNIELSNEGYAIAKIATIKLCEYISKKYNYNYFSLIPCNIYGPHDKFDEKKGHVVGSLIKKISTAKEYNKKNVEIWNSKKSTNPKEFRSTLDKDSIFYKIKKRFKIKSNFTYIIFLINSLKSIKFFK